MPGFFERLFGLGNTEPEGVYKPFSDEKTLEEAKRVLSALEEDREKARRQNERIKKQAEKLWGQTLYLTALSKGDKGVEFLEHLRKNEPEAFQLVLNYFNQLEQSRKKAQKTGHSSFDPKQYNNEQRIKRKLEERSKTPTTNHNNVREKPVNIVKNVELPSDVKARRVKEQYGYRREDGSVNPLYEDANVIKLEGPLFDPRQYNEEQMVKRELEKVEESLREKPLPSEEDKIVRILPIEEPKSVSIVHKLEELVSFYDNDPSLKLIDKENGKTNIKVDEKLYNSFLNRTFAATIAYLEEDKGKKNSKQRSFFESLEDSVLGVWKEGSFNIESRLDPFNHGYRNETASEKLSYKEGVSFEKQYNKVLYSSLDNFKGKNKDEQKVSKAKSLVSLLAEYIAFNADRIDRTTVLEYSRKINDYIKKHVKDESLREELKISLSYDRERKTFIFETEKKSPLIYTLNNNSRKVELVKYIYHEHKDSYETNDKKVEEKGNEKGKKKRRSFREFANDAVASIVVSPGYVAGIAANLAGKGVKKIGEGLEAAGNYVSNFTYRVKEGLTRPYTVVPVDEYNRLKAHVKNTSESGKSEKNKNESSDN